MSEVSYLRTYENQKNSSSPQEDDDEDLYGNGGGAYEDEDHGDDGEEELNTNEKILTSIYLQSNRKFLNNGITAPITAPTIMTGTPTAALISISDSIGGETDNDSEKDANHALAAIHISDATMKLKRDNNSQSPSPLTDDATGSVDSPDSSRINFHHETLPYMSSQIPKHVFDHPQEVPMTQTPHPGNPSAFTKQSTYRKSQENNYQHPQHNLATTSGSNTFGSVSYPPSQLYNHRPPAHTSLGNLNFLSSTNSSSSSTPSFLTDDFLLLTPSQQAQATSSSVSTNPSSYHLLTPLLPSNSSNSNDSLHSLQLENQPTQSKYSAFPSSTPHSVSELYYPLRDLTSLTPNTPSVPSTVSAQQVSSRSSPLQANSTSRKQGMSHASRAGRGKAHASNSAHGKNLHAVASNGAYNKSHSSSPHVPPGTSNPKISTSQNDKRPIVPSVPTPPSSSLLVNSSTIPENALVNTSSVPSAVPNFNMTPNQQPPPNNGPLFSSNMATIQQAKKKFSSVVKSSGAGDSGNSNDLLMSSINGMGPSSTNGSTLNHSQQQPPSGMTQTKPKTTQRKSRKNLLSHTPGTRLERSVSDLGTSDHLYNDHFANLDPDNFHFSAFLDTHLNDGFKPEVKNRSLSWQHSGSTGKSSLKPKNTERKNLKTGIKMNGGHSNLSAPGLLLSTSTPDFGDPNLGNGLENIFNQPMKKKRTSKGAKFRMFTRVWVPAFNVAGCITQEKNGGWKYVQFDTGLPLPLPNSSSSNSSTPQPSPRLLSKGLLDGKWCRACDMEEIPDGSSTGPVGNGNGMNGSTMKDHHHHSSFPSSSHQSSIRHDFCGDNDSDAEFDGNLLGIADSFGLISGNPLQYFTQNSNHGDLGSDDDFGSLPLTNSTGPSASSRVTASGSHHDTTPILTDDLDQLDSFLMKRRRDRSDSLDLLNTNLNDRDVFMTLGINTKLDDSMMATGGGKNTSNTGSGGGVSGGGLGIGGVGVLDDVSWHNIEYSGINLDDCDWNL